MTDNTNFTRIMDGLNEVLRHASGEEVPGMVIHRVWHDGDQMRLESIKAEDFYLTADQQKALPNEREG